MIGLLLLTVPMLAILAYGVLEVKRSRVVGVAISVLTLAALAFLWLPGFATLTAAALQIGTGNDLVIYAWVALITLILLNLHLRMRQQMQLVAALTRQIAMAGRTTPTDLAGPSTYPS